MQSSGHIIGYIFFTGNVLPLTWVRIVLDLPNPCRDKRLETAGRTLDPGKCDTAVSEEFDIRKLNRRGIVSCFRGATVDLAATKFTS